MQAKGANTYTLALWYSTKQLIWDQSLSLFSCSKHMVCEGWMRQKLCRAHRQGATVSASILTRLREGRREIHAAKAHTEPAVGKKDQ